MDNKRNPNSGGGMNIFILGILIGVMATLLFSTKKGRKILQKITDEGIERLSKWEDLVEIVEEHLGKDDSVVGEDPKEELAQLEAPIEVIKEKEIVVEPKEPQAPKVKKETKKVSKKEVVLEKVKEVEKEVELTPEVVEEEVKQALEEAETVEVEDLPLHKALSEDIKEELPIEEEPKKISRRLFKGIRRK